MATPSVSLDMNMEELIEALKIRITTILNLPDVTPADIPVDGELVGGALDIDSIDVLEIIIMLRKEYGVVIKNKQQGKQVFSSLRTLAAYILENQGGS
jgi:acyl carrier protein